MDSLVLVDGLFCYSERGQGYIDDVKQVIDHNELRKYDGLLLKEPDQPESLGRIASPGKLTAAGAAVFNEKDQVLNNRTS
jgi:hypothetical protein